MTVDCGASGGAAFEAARVLGLNVVVLDHHRVEARPDALAHVNPNQPGDTSGPGYLCAAGVTFLFLVALNRALRESGFYEARGRTSRICANISTWWGWRRFAMWCRWWASTAPLCARAWGNYQNCRVPAWRRWRRSPGRRRPLPPIIWVLSSGRASMPVAGSVGPVWAPICCWREKAAAEEFALQLDLHNRERREIEKTILEEAVALASVQENAPFPSGGWRGLASRRGRHCRRAAEGTVFQAGLCCRI